MTSLLASPPPVATCELELRVSGPGVPAGVTRVSDRTISLGAGPRCTVRLNAPGLRPMHCLITRTDEGMSVRRWASDTLLNGRHFSDSPLASGDRLTIGGVVVEIHEAGANNAPPESRGEPSTAEAAHAAVVEAESLIAADLATDQVIAIEPIETPEPGPALKKISAVPERLLKPWLAVQTHLPEQPQAVAPVSPRDETPVLAPLELAPGAASPAKMLSAEVLSAESETVDFVPPALVATSVPVAENLAPVIERLRERLAWNRQRVARLATALRTERAGWACETEEFEQLRTSLAAMTAERDSLEVAATEANQLAAGLIPLQAELQAALTELEVLRNATSLAPAEVQETSAATAEHDTWGDFVALPNASESTPVAVQPAETWNSAPGSESAWSDLTWDDTRATSSEDDPFSAPADNAFIAEEPLPAVANTWWSEEAVEAPAQESFFVSESASAAEVFETSNDEVSQSESSWADPFAADDSPWEQIAQDSPVAAPQANEDEFEPATEAWSLADALGTPVSTELSSVAVESPEVEPESVVPAVYEEVAVQAELATDRWERLESETEESIQASPEPEVTEQASDPEDRPVAELPFQSALFTTPVAPATPSGSAAPASFIERYAHLLDQEGEPEPVPAPAPVLPQAVVASSESLEGDEEESIDDYMGRLLQRMRGESDPAPSVERAVAKPTASSMPRMGQPTVVSPVIEKGPVSEQPLTSLDEIRRVAPNPEAKTDMSALRALANQNARHNIGVAAVKKHREFALTKLVIALMVVGGGAVLALMAPDVLGLQMIGSCVAMLVAGFYAGRTMRLLKEAIKEAKPR